MIDREDAEVAGYTVVCPDCGDQSDIPVDLRDELEPPCACGPKDLGRMTEKAAACEGSIGAMLPIPVFLEPDSCEKCSQFDCACGMR